MWRQCVLEAFELAELSVDTVNAPLCLRGLAFTEDWSDKRFAAGHNYNLRAIVGSSMKYTTLIR